MRRIALLVAVLFIVAGCSSGEGDSGDTQTAQQPSATDQPKPGTGQARIPEVQELPETTEGVSLRPYFDAEGTKETLAVAPGENFSFYVVAEYVEPYHIAAAQYRVELPDGITILGDEKFDAQVLTMGQYQQSFSMAFACLDPGKRQLIKINCKADESFSGGEIQVADAVPGQGPPFLGFVTCGHGQPQKLPAHGGNARLDKK